MHPWNIVFKVDRAFVNKGDGYILCIGSSEEARKASSKKLAEMIHDAMVWEKFWEIEGFVKHPTIH